MIKLFCYYSQRYEDAIEHLHRARTEQQNYKNQCQETRDLLYTFYHPHGPPPFGSSSPVPLSGPKAAHHSFHLPNRYMSTLHNAYTTILIKTLLTVLTAHVHDIGALSISSMAARANLIQNTNKMCDFWYTL